MFGINATCDISKLSQISLAHEITFNNFEISLVVFMQNITTNHAVTYPNCMTSDISLTISQTLFNYLLQMVYSISDQCYADLFTCS